MITNIIRPLGAAQQDPVSVAKDEAGLEWMEEKRDSKIFAQIENKDRHSAG